MSCNSTNQFPQKYRLTYPEKNTVFYTNTPPPDYYRQVNNMSKRLNFTPTTCNQCSSTFFEPGNKQTQNQCLENCTGIKTYKIDGCEYENMRFRPKIVDNGCLMEPSVMNYTNVPLSPPVFIAPGCQKDRKYNPPPPPGYLNSFKPYDILQYVSWTPYNY